MNLTEKQQAVYDFLKYFSQKEGYSPTLREIAIEMGLNSTRTVVQHLLALQKKSLVRRSPYKQRGIVLIEPKDITPELVEIPVIGCAGCNEAPTVIAEQQYDEYTHIPKNLFKSPNDKLVAIRAIGDSMLEAGIKDNDLVVIKLTNDIRDNDVVLVVIGDTAVIKKITYANNAIILNPISQDPKYLPNIVNFSENPQVLGKFVKIVTPQLIDGYTVERIKEERR